MKKITFYFLSFCVAVISAGAQGPYSLSSIPESVKNKASVITHLEDFDLEVEGLDKTNLKVHKIFTVMNEEGKDALFFNEYSSKYISLDDAEIKVYDANGKQTGKYKKKEMTTVGVGEGLIEEGYVTYYHVSTTSYPVTVEIRYEKKIKSTLSVPDFRFIHPHEGIVESNYTARVPTEIPLRYKAENITIEPAVSIDGKYKVYKWTVKNLSPIAYEEGAVSEGSRYPHIKIVTDQFSHYGFRGDLSSWKSFGTWIKDLYKGLDVLPPERQQFFLQLVKDAPDEKEKIRRIYKYMQQNFRYVSIQLGIGGLRPFSADFTDKKKYGDCKALSNYMKAALATVGIRSHVAIINATYNEPPVDPGFPSNNFNHVILCVPSQGDSIWLECTSATAEFGQLGTFTENRNALLITEDGGVLAATPKSNSSANILSTRTTIAISDDLSAETETFFTTKGEFREIMNEILKEKKDEQKKAIVSYFGFKQPDVFELIKDPTDADKTRLRMFVSKVPEFNAGTKSFINPRIHKIWTSKLPKSENRRLDFYFRYPFEKYDTTVFKLPAAVATDALPTEKVLTCPYASYKSTYWYNEPERSVYVATALVLKQHKVNSADYATVKKFFDDLLQDDSQKIVVKKQETIQEAQKKAF